MQTQSSPAKQTQYLQVRLSPDLKSAAEAILSQLGLSTSQAVKMFLRQVVMRQAIPFSITVKEETYPMVTEEEERQIGKALKNFQQGKYVTIDMNNKEQVRKYFGI